MVRKEEAEEMELEEQDIGEFLERVTPFIEALAPRIVEYQKAIEPRVKRAQWMNFVIMLGIVISISILAWQQIIDGSAATGLIGAIIGYVFGGLYTQSKSK